MKKIILTSLFFISLSLFSCVKNIGNGEPPYLIFTFNDNFYSDTTTDNDTFIIDISVIKANNAEINQVNFIINQQDTTTYSYNDFLSDSLLRIYFTPNYQNLKDTTIDFIIYGKPSNSDIISSRGLYLVIKPDTTH
ncbi:MAG: hypothetical protein JXL97_15565 [Bacteroidales bacterium]|nr:hypothetical protein [Bacteroidales bacterium]